jgi:hypothetical protein
MKLPKTFIPDKNLEEKTEELLTFKKKKRVFNHAKLNKLKSDDERVQYFYDLWCEQAFTSEGKKQDSVAKAYCLHVLGISKYNFEDFRDHSIQAYDHVGQLQSGLLDRKNDFKSFWDEMSNIFPYDYIKEDLEFLISNGETPVFHLVDQFETYKPSTLLEKLRKNAHVYK